LPVGAYDLQIGAIALTNNLILITHNLITHNVREFDRVDGLQVENGEIEW
jgi:tRNA(fMet)-specific endonuclease VapC